MRLHRAAQFLLVVLFILGWSASANAFLAPTSPAYRHYHPQFLKSSSGASSTLHLQNTSNASAHVEFGFYAADGTIKASAGGDIASMGAFSLAATEVSGLPDGAYALVVSANQTLESVVRTLTAGAPESLAAQRGQPAGARSLRLGPVYKDIDGLDTSITIFNVGYESSLVTVRYVNSSGATVHTASATVPMLGFKTFSSAPLSAGFEGWASVEAAEPVTGIVDVFDPVAHTLEETRGPVGAAGAPGSLTEVSERSGRLGPLPDGPTLITACVARALKHSDQGTGLRSTTLIVGNSATVPSTVVLAFYDSEGGETSLPSFDLGAGASKAVPLEDLTLLSNGAWAACARSDQPATIGELTTLDSAGSANETTYYASSVADSGLYYLYAPRCANDETGHAVLTVRNTGTVPATVTVRMRDINGVEVYAETASLASMGWETLNLAKIAAFSAGFVGTGEVISDQALAAAVDELGPRPAAVSDVEGEIDDSAKVELAWSPVATDTRGFAIESVTYDVHRAKDDAYFLPTAIALPYAPGLVAPGFQDSDATVLADVDHPTFYLIKTTFHGAEAEPSARVGVIVFGLTRGGS